MDRGSGKRRYCLPSNKSGTLCQTSSLQVPRNWLCPVRLEELSLLRDEIMPRLWLEFAAMGHDAVGVGQGVGERW